MGKLIKGKAVFVAESSPRLLLKFNLAGGFRMFNLFMDLDTVTNEAFKDLDDFSTGSGLRILFWTVRFFKDPLSVGRTWFVFSKELVLVFLRTDFGFLRFGFKTAFQKKGS